MRWRALFEDLEAQADALDRAELDAEVADRLRRERARLRLVDRLVPSVGSPVQLDLEGAGSVRGTLTGVGPDWVLVQEPAGELLAPSGALMSVTGLRAGARPPGSEGEVARRLDLGHALRGVTRDRSEVSVVLRSGAALHGTLDRVGADFLELAEHPPGEVRRRQEVRGARLVSLPAVAALRRR